MSTEKNQLFTGVIWSLIGQFGYLAITLITNIILARLLDPSEFGKLGIIFFFILVSRVLIESGLGGSIIRTKNISEKDYSTVFIFNLVISFILAGIIFFSANYVSNIYDTKELEQYLKISTLILIVNSFQFTQTTKLVKELKFKRKSIYDFFAILIGSSIGVTLAYFNYGVYAFIYMQICTSLFLTIIIWLFEGGIVKLYFSFSILKRHLHYGINTTLSSILNTAFDNIYSLILAKYFSINQTGFLYHSKKLYEIPTGILNKLSQGVIFSNLSKIQNNKKQLENNYNEIINLFTLAVGLICVLIFTYSKLIVLTLYGKEWIGSIFYLDVFIISSFFYLQEMFNRVLFKIYNKTHVILKLEILKKIILTITIIISVYYHDLKMMMYTFLLSTIISYFINYLSCRITFKHLNTRNIKQVISVLFISILIASIFKYYILSKASITKNVISIPILLSLYIILNIVFKNMNLKTTLKMIKR